MKQNKKQPSPLARLRQYRLFYHLLLIAAILFALAVGSHLVMQLGTRHGARRTVPDFTGILLSDAERVAAKHDLELHINDSLFVPAYEGGIVLDQLPEQGVEVKPGRTVYITINSFRQKMVEVPYVAGRSLRQAKNMLEVAGLEIDRLVYEEDIATNYVLAVEVEGRELQPDSRVEIEMGEGVVLRVGVEPEKNSTIVPKAIGQSLATAKSRLWEQGLNIGKINFDEGINLLNQKDARIYRQSLAHNATATLGASVDLWLTLDEKLVEKNSNASDKAARELEEERLKAEEALRDSLEQAEAAERNALLNAIEQSNEQSADIVETEEDEFFQ